MKTGFLERPDCRIYYEASGQGPAIVFAHGLGGNHLSWWQQVAHFSARYTCVVFAHRGFPPSTPVDGAKAPDAYADDLAALIDELELDEVRLVAQSMGGWTCLEYALRQPAKVKALVMAATSGAVEPFTAEGFTRNDFQAWTKEAEKHMRDFVTRGIHPASGERMHREQPALAALYGQIARLGEPGFRDAVRERIRALRNQAPARLAGLAMPVLFINGDEDWVFPSAAGPELARFAPKGRAVAVARSAHSVYFERAAEFNRIVEEFLQ